jgi:acyl-coenzyme A synthetase/AMP-(fatty) acid ligase
MKFDPKPEGMMVEYYKDKDKIAQAFAVRFYHTGDTPGAMRTGISIMSAQ